VLTEYVAMPSTEITVHLADIAAAAASPWLADRPAQRDWSKGRHL
jgi:hypothetical protein